MDRETQIKTKLSQELAAFYKETRFAAIFRQPVKRFYSH